MQSTDDQTPTGIEAFDRVRNQPCPFSGKTIKGTVHNVSRYDGSWFLCILWDGDTTTDDCVPFAEVTKV